MAGTSGNTFNGSYRVHQLLKCSGSLDIEKFWATKIFMSSHPILKILSCASYFFTVRWTTPLLLKCPWSPDIEQFWPQTVQCQVTRLLLNFQGNLTLKKRSQNCPNLWIFQDNQTMNNFGPQMFNVEWPSPTSQICWGHLPWGMPKSSLETQNSYTAIEFKQELRISLSLAGKGYLSEGWKTLSFPW